MVALPIIVCIVLIPLVIYAIIHGSKAAKARSQAIGAWAHDNHWRFSEASDSGFDERYRHFALFNSGHTRRARNIVGGVLMINEREHAFEIGDYSYKTTSTDSKGRTTTTTHPYSVLILHTPYPHLPELTIRREHFFDKVGGLLGFDDIDFEDAEFSKRYHVKCKDRRFAYDLLDPRMIEFLKEHMPTVPGLHFERGQLLLAKGGAWKTVADFQHALTFAEAFTDRVPDHLLAQWEGDSSFRTGVETEAPS